MIELQGVTKWYPTRHGRKYVLRDVEAQLPAGRHMALLGRNGAGKTTLLRLIGGIDHPSSGRILRRARVSWPVGLTGGFQGSLTGRENARFVCRINGVSHRPAMRERIEYVREFADIGAYFDEPVKTYSSGMRARVGFALSMAFEFDYYLIDEIMAVGDQSFREKCSDELARRRGRGTFIVASHDIRLVQDICDRGIVVADGSVSVFAQIADAVEAYRATTANRGADPAMLGDPRDLA